ncbi:glycine betaine/L-proline ABC transporter ATP-binding protein [Endozoicomonas sp. 4G]|uniref:quaternary amine ABC transporter ATP-binding protein n=1 Tax=Endozoicomonas sp. 4G TaxID=2872754 RepID=UPI0020789825|nr:glycine betaine/L-proline ABC transporter ATP-binding protein [Endozoicomonas sp. 4G]
MSELICVRNLYKIFGKTPERVLGQVKSGLGKNELLAQTHHGLGLKDINLTINRGEIFVIMGLSGSGKSTLIRHFNRLIDPTEGDIIVDGVNVMKLGKRELEQFRRHKMSMVFQRFGLLPHRSVIDNVSYGLKVQGVSKAERQKKAQEWLATVGLEGYEKQFPSQLSGGQQQRVGLARALCTNAEILLMDEAFSALDPLIRSEMQDQLIELQEKLKKTIVFITHDLDEALRLGDRIAILKDGELVQLGKPEDILLNPATDYVEAFVKDVNRARALTVETVMQPPVNRITANTIGEALEQMKKLPKRYGYYFNEQGYQGIVLQDTLEEAAQTHASDALGEEMVEELEAVSPDAILESVIPDTLETEYPLPVVDETGEFQGELSRTNLIEVLGETSNQAA